MAVCSDCNQEMTEAHSCNVSSLRLVETELADGEVGKEYNRDTTYYDYNTKCHDCGIVNGNGHFHHFGCDIERCPVCGRQIISCGHFFEPVIHSIIDEP